MFRYDFGRAWARAALLGSVQISTLGVFAAATAHAQETLQTITVTARRVAENVQSVPLTVNVLTANEVQSRGIENLAQINGILPNVVWEDFGGSMRNTISIRGIPSGERNTGIDPGVGIYVDDVYQPNGIGFNQSLLDISRIEVIKGPQGTLFGRNTIDGVISIHTVKPSTSEMYVSGSLSVGDYGLIDRRAVVNIPLSAVSALKLSGIDRKRDGYDFDVVTGKRVNGEDHYGGRAQLSYQSSERFDALLTGYYFRDSAPQDLPRCGVGVLPGICPTGGAHVLAANPPNTSNRNMSGTSLEMNWTRADWGSLTSITAFQHLDANENQDQDAVSLDLLRSGFDVPRDDTFTEEFRLTTPQDKRLHGVTGMFYLHEDKESDTPQVYTSTLIALANGPSNGSYGIAGNADLFTLNKQDTGSFAVFGQGSFDITRRLIAEVGLRNTWDSKSFTFAQTTSGTDVCFGFGSPAPINNCPFPAFKGDKSWSALSGTASLSYHISRAALGYLRLSRGYKSGGWNGSQLSPGTNPTVPFNPEFLNMVELGTKYESSEHRFVLNTAIFYNDYQDMQLLFQNPVTFVQFISNAGGAKSEGLELEGRLIPFDGMVLNADLGLLDTKITRVAASPALSGLLGKQFPFAPRRNASLTGTYTHPLWDSVDGMASVTATYRSDEFIDSQSTVTSGAFTQLGARVGVEAENGRWDVYLSGQNLTDVTRETEFIANAPWASNLGAYNAPRTFEFQVEFKL